MQTLENLFFLKINKIMNFAEIILTYHFQDKGVELCLVVPIIHHHILRQINHCLQQLACDFPEHSSQIKKIKIKNIFTTQN